MMASSSPVITVLYGDKSVRNDKNHLLYQDLTGLLMSENTALSICISPHL